MRMDAEPLTVFQNHPRKIRFEHFNTGMVSGYEGKKRMISGGATAAFSRLEWSTQLEAPDILGVVLVRLFAIFDANG